MTSTIVGYCNPFSDVGEKDDTIKTTALDDSLPSVDPAEKTIVSPPWWEPAPSRNTVTARCFPPVSASSLLPALPPIQDPPLPTMARHPCMFLPVLDPPAEPDPPSSVRVLATFFSILALMAASAALLVAFIGT